MLKSVLRSLFGHGWVGREWQKACSEPKLQGERSLEPYIFLKLRFPPFNWQPEPIHETLMSSPLTSTCDGYTLHAAMQAWGNERTSAIKQFQDKSRNLTPERGANLKETLENLKYLSGVLGSDLQSGPSQKFADKINP